MPNSYDFFVQQNGSPLTGAAGSFTAIARSISGATRTAPTIVELGEGVYRITPTATDESVGTVVSIDLASGREPRRVTFACYLADNSNQFWATAIQNPDGSNWGGSAPTVTSYRSSAGTRTPPTPTAVESTWLFVFIPTLADIVADVEILISGPASSAQSYWIGSTDPIVNINTNASGFNTGLN